MTRRRNDEVVNCWVDGTSATNHRGSFTTDGIHLWSYKLLIGDTCLETKKKVLREYVAKTKWGFKSQTTSCHVGLARKHADVID